LEGAEIYKGEIINISVLSNDSKNSLTEVRFYIQDDFTGVDRTPPYSYEWNTENAGNGIHVIRAIAFYNEGNYVIDEVSVLLLSREPPEVFFSADQTRISPGTPVQFTDHSTNKPVEWLWDFGDGQTSSEQNPLHVYLSPGSYTIDLTVSNPYGSGRVTRIDYIAVIESGRFTDFRDGNTYRTVKAGRQEWMAENLAYLPSISLPKSGSISEPLYYVHGYEGTSVMEAKGTDNYKTYGALYNWPATIEAAPEGWHVPSDEEWKELEMYLGMSQSDADYIGFRGTNQGSKLAGGANLWQDDSLVNNDAFGSSGFMALPGGYRLYNSAIPLNFLGYGYECKWWSSTEIFHDTTSAWVRELWSNYSKVYRLTGVKDLGYSIRCVKD
jgi:uncharacterized protein (TIGR02145 family)